MIAAVLATGALVGGVWWMASKADQDTAPALVTSDSTPASTTTPPPTSAAPSDTSDASDTATSDAPTPDAAATNSPTGTPSPLPEESGETGARAPEVTGTAPRSTGTEDPQAAAVAALEERRRAALNRFESGPGVVVQLASKVPGTEDRNQTTSRGSHRFDASDILEEVVALENTFGDVVVLHPADIRIKGSDAMWITLYDGRRFADKAEARAWCAAAFPDESGDALDNRCLPRRLK